MFLEKLVKINGYCLKYIPDVFKDDLNLALIAVKQNRESYDFVDNFMKLDKDVSAAFMKYSMI